ncbi:MAG: FN3 associated domain-containing protein [Bacteroidota bacterium]
MLRIIVGLFCLLIVNNSLAQKVKKPDFSVKRGFYLAPFKLKLTSKLKGQIYYTLDGSHPTDSTGLVYKKPISISRSTVVKAYLQSRGEKRSKVAVHSYLFPAQVVDQPDSLPDWPRPMISTDYAGGSVKMSYGMYPAIVNEDRTAMLKSLESLPSISISMKLDDFWKMTLGFDELPMSVEVLFPSDPSANTQAFGGIEGVSHKHLKRNYRLSFKKKYGDGKLKTELLRKHAPLHQKEATQKFDRLVLRAGTQRSWTRNWYPDKTAFTRDQWARDASIDMMGTGARGTFVHLYVNGAYMGLYNATERPDEKFVETYLKGEEDNWYVFNHNGTLHGADSSYKYLKYKLLRKDFTEEGVYEEFSQLVDVDAFCDYLILSWYIGMVDWPENNYYGAMNLTDSVKLRFFIWDAEMSWDEELDGSAGAWVHYEFLNDEEGDSEISRMWHAVRENEIFMQRFIDRVYLHCFHGGALAEENNLDRWHKLNGYIRKAVLAESARWGSSLDEKVRTRDETWKLEVDRVAEMMKGNSQRFIEALREEGYYPDIDPPAFTLQREDNGEAIIELQSTVQGKVLYTLDGSDPMGSESSKSYEGPVTLPNGAMFKARTLTEETWSALWFAD